MFDMLLIDKVLAEKNITLLLNTCAFSVDKKDSSTIGSVKAYCSSSETFYNVSASFFADCSGDGFLSYLAGVPYRIGAEDKEEYGEDFAPDKEKYGEVMGHSIFFYMKDTGSPVSFVKPDFALDNIQDYVSKINNSEYFSVSHHGCKYWWLEYGGRLDTIHDTEKIKYELWKVVYGIWDYIKNSGRFPEMRNYTLEWVGLIPGKRESRRFKGMYVLSQKDIIEQRRHYDAVAYGGWAIDLHPADGVYASGRACNQWHSKGVYQIPFRCYLSENIDNLMFGGRIISTTHVANGSTRVMCTSALGGEVIGTTISLCVRDGLLPRDFTAEDRIRQLQGRLLRNGNFIPGVGGIAETDDIMSGTSVGASSVFDLSELPGNGEYEPLTFSEALLLPVKGYLPKFVVSIEAKENTTVEVQLRKSSKRGNYTPDIILESRSFALDAGMSGVGFESSVFFPETEYVFITVMANAKASILKSDMILTGVTTVYNQVNIAVSNYGRQDTPEGIGVESFEFWCPKRRPEAKNMAISFAKPLSLYSTENVRTSYLRPFNGTNAWAADIADETPELHISWDGRSTVSKVVLDFDVDYDHAMETVQYGHYDSVMPQCVRDFNVCDCKGRIFAEVRGNHLGHVVVDLGKEYLLDNLRLVFRKPSPLVPVSIARVSVR